MPINWFTLKCLVLLALCVPTMASAPVMAAPCSPSMMKPQADTLRPNWTNGAGKTGVWALFQRTGPNSEPNPCVNCHAPTKNAAAWASYVPCFECHQTAAQVPGTPGAAIGVMGYPNYLIFDYDSLKNKTSYYSPGYSKGVAALNRAVDGTMPLGKPAPGWCDEIADVVRRWIDAGMPL